MLLKLLTGLFRSSPKRRQTIVRRFGIESCESLEARCLLTAAYCPPPSQPAPTQSPVKVNNHIVTITGTVGSDSIFIQQTGNVTQIFVGANEYDVSGVRGIIFNGKNNAATSTDNVYIDTSVRTIIELDAGAGINNFQNDSCSSTLMVGTTGTDSFVGGTGCSVFVLGKGDSRVTTGTGVNEVTCSSSTLSSAELDLFGFNIVYLGNGDVTIYGEADSSGIIIGNRAAFRDLEFSKDPDADCYIGFVTWC